MSTKSAPRAAIVSCFALTCASGLLLAQTVIQPPKNKYTPKQDVELGREAAAEVRKQYPIIKDEKIAAYLTTLGDRLVAAAPAELKNPVYEYSFTPVNLKEINAFALPGGPMFVHRGMIEAAATEAEVAGVMAHELAHVLLRHGTANATKAQNPWLQLGQIAGVVGGAVVGGQAGSAISQGTQFGLGTMLLRYSRDFEKQADLMGVQIMARAGYDPRALAHMFETIAAESKSGGGNPQFLSDHPNPGNRSQYINQEASLLTIAATADSSQFAPIKAVFASQPAAMTSAQMQKANAAAPEGGGVGGGGVGGGEMSRSVGTPGRPVPKPSMQFHDIAGGKVFQASVPVDWSSVASKSSIKVVPQNGYGDLEGHTVFTHGVEFGISKVDSRDLREATRVWLQAVAHANPELKLAGEQQQTRISQRTAIATPLTNPSALGGLQRVNVYTTFLTDGTLFYCFSVVPESDAPAFDPVFRHIVDSIKLTEVR